MQQQAVILTMDKPKTFKITMTKKMNKRTMSGNKRGDEEQDTSEWITYCFKWILTTVGGTVQQWKEGLRLDKGKKPSKNKKGLSQISTLSPTLKSILLKCHVLLLMNSSAYK